MQVSGKLKHIRIITLRKRGKCVEGNTSGRKATICSVIIAGRNNHKKHITLMHKKLGVSEDVLFFLT